MTTIYFVRHAEPDYDNHDDTLRPLTEKGRKDRGLVTEYLSNKNIRIALSSPYKRAYDTILDFTVKNNLEILCIDDFRERKIDSVWIEDYEAFSKNQWDDFLYRYSDGECLKEVQERNIRALHKVLLEYRGKNIVIGSHGTALSTIINYYDKSFGYNEFQKIKSLMPWIVKFKFNDLNCVHIERINLFEDNIR